MKYRKLDNNRDYTLGAKPSETFVYNTEAVIQAIVTRMNHLLSEWWEDLDDGLPLFEEILGRFNDVETVELIITERISETLGVSYVDDIYSSLDEDNRKFAYSCSVTTVFNDNEEITLAFDGIAFYREEKR